jgi:hypothetical protein
LRLQLHRSLRILLLLGGRWVLEWPRPPIRSPIASRSHSVGNPKSRTRRSRRAPNSVAASLGPGESLRPDRARAQRSGPPQDGARELRLLPIARAWSRSTARRSRIRISAISWAPAAGRYGARRRRLRSRTAVPSAAHRFRRHDLSPAERSVFGLAPGDPRPQPRSSTPARGCRRNIQEQGYPFAQVDATGRL